MTPVTVGIAVFALMVVLLVLGVPVAATMGFSGMLGLIYLLTLDPALVKLAVSPVATMNSYSFTVVPLFMLMANIIASTGIGKLLYDLFYKMVGRFRGGLAMMILTLPVLLPIVSALNFDLVWFGVFMTASIQLANITPPVDMNLFVTKGLDERISMKIESPALRRAGLRYGPPTSQNALHFGMFL